MNRRGNRSYTKVSKHMLFKIRTGYLRISVYRDFTKFCKPTTDSASNAHKGFHKYSHDVIIFQEYTCLENADALKMS